MRDGAGVLAYLKAAFLWRWNLLALVGGIAAAVISPFPTDALLPLIGAAELVYLASLTAVPRFRAAIDARVHAATTGSGLQTEAGERQLPSDLIRNLDPEAQQRMARLRSRCLDMRNLASGVRGQTTPGRGDDLNTPSLDRLLWVFLRLLHSQQALRGFLRATDSGQIESALNDLRQRETQARERKDERILRSLVDSIATAELRLGNYQKAQANAEFVAVELDRIEGKIQALTEMSVSHQDPDFLSSQVDSVAASMSQTEDAIRELNHLTGLTDAIEDAPSILGAEMPPPVIIQGQSRRR